MPESTSNIQIPFQKQTQSLASALSEKGTPGIILLGIIFFVIWMVPTIFTIGIFLKIPTEVAIQKDDFWLFGCYLIVLIIGLFVIIFVSYKLSQAVIKSITPVLTLESGSTSFMPGAFGGKVPTLSGKLIVSKLDSDTARRRILKIMEALVFRVAEGLEIGNTKLIRSNIFISEGDLWLNIADNFHINMDDGTTELTIKIPNGGLASGTTYRYFLPSLSVLEKNEEGDKVWQYTPGKDSPINSLINKNKYIDEVNKEMMKVHRNLRWAISMPIPHQVQPFKIASGVLNIDGLEKKDIVRDQLLKLLSDTACAAAIIGVINRTTDVLGGQCQRQVNIEKEFGETHYTILVKKYTIDPSDFDPANCPEPSNAFINAVARIDGLEFFKDISPTEVSEYLREQLRS